MNSLIGFPELVLLLLAAIWLLYYGVFLYFRKSELLLRNSVTLREATVSRQFVPRFDLLVESGDRLIFVGGDGYYHGTNGGVRLRDAMTSWCERGCSIEYVLVSGSGLANQPLLEMLHDQKSMKVYFVSEGKQKTVDGHKDTSIAKLTEEYRTFHPTILFGGNGEIKAAWVEGYHPESSHIAYDISFQCDEFSEGDLTEIKRYCNDVSALMKNSLLVDSTNYREVSTAHLP